MVTQSSRAPTNMSAPGSSNIQVGGNYTVTEIHVHNGVQTEQPPRGPSAAERAQLAQLVDEVVNAEAGLVCAKIVRATLNVHVDVKTVSEMTHEQFSRALVFLLGWKSCAQAKELTPDATIAQILRMWAAVPALRGLTTEFSRGVFHKERLKNMTSWELRCTLGFVMSRWQAYWEQRKQ